ncbi:T9SS type A sorting domain-containing protein [Spirosoma rhododendri]|uniref:T9SS type A sorting domain-containing protein n=1 Tax=Spirosoma rhododendri TaxID=2728024 RepID=A0A7L5DRK8_9BACT|nr:T9SS type A sorting domain-containing protein [Spirosoma rhododendri]QJD78597.1 T9SS type A sorting domain-containing protein [Spirosoma rhododendri]
MKKHHFPTRWLSLMLVTLATVGGSAYAQKAKTPSASPDEIHVQIIERDGNEVRETERTYRTDGMKDPERDRMVTKLVDSLKAARQKTGGDQQLTIIVEDGKGSRSVTRERSTAGAQRRKNDVYVWRGKRSTPNSGPGWQYELRRGADSLNNQINRLQLQFPADWDRQLARPFEAWARNMESKPSSVRGLDVFPNNPDKEQLNIRFTAPAKGDVLIVVTNPKGKEVARREIKDFSGEYVGQISLSRKAEGTYFVTVTQNEDGAVKRVVVN